MTADLLRLVALAATLVPSRAARLLGRLEVPGGSVATRHAGSLAEAPRRARLAALAAALPDVAAPDHHAPPHPLLRRLERERWERPAAERTLVRDAAPPARRSP